MKDGSSYLPSRTGVSNRTNALTRAQTQRALAVLEETLDKLKFLGTITPDVLSHREELSQFVGEEISRIIAEQRQLEKRYEELISQRGALKGLANKSRYKENQRKIQEVSRKLRDSTKNLCCNLKDNPNVGGNLLKIQKERTDLEELMRSLFREIGDTCRFDRLQKIVETHKQAQSNIDSLKKREKELTASVLELQEEVQTEKEEHDLELKERTRLIASLKAELQSMKTHTVTTMGYARAEAMANVSSKQRTYAQIQKELRRQIAQLTRKKKVEAAVHKETLKELTANQQELMEASSAWSDKYQKDIEYYEEEIKRETELKEQTHEQLKLLRDRRENELLEQAAAEAERKRNAELARLKREEIRNRDRAAFCIQSQWRQTMVMAKQQKEEAGKKSKKKKGKKKKGKKKK